MLEDKLRMPHLQQCNPVMRGPVARRRPGTLDVIGGFVNMVYGQAAGFIGHLEVVANCRPVLNQEPLLQAKARASNAVNLRESELSMLYQLIKIFLNFVPNTLKLKVAGIQIGHFSKFWVPYWR
jgi:hypothetical protein